MNKKKIKITAIGLVVLSTLFFLYFNTQVVDPNKHQKILSQFSAFNQEDAILNQNILEIRQGLLLNYDSPAKQLKKLDVIISRVNLLLRDLHPTQDTLFAQNLSLIKEALDNKKELIEGFKSSNALLRNSLRYLPTATTALAKRLPFNAPLKTTLDNLLRDVLIYNITSDPVLIKKISYGIKTLKNEIATHAPNFSDNTKILIRHADIIINNKKLTNTYVTAIILAPTSERMNHFVLIYSSDHAQLMQHVNFYRQVLYGFSVTLLLIIAYILYRLNQTTRILRSTINDLNYQKFAMDQHVIISTTDTRGNITYVNQKFCDISQQSKESLIGKNHRISNSAYHPLSFYKNMWETITAGNVWRGQIRNIADNGNIYWVDTTIVPFLDEENKPYQYMAIRTDITEIKQVEELLSVQAAALEAAAQGIVITDTDGKIQWVNKAYTKITGFSNEEAINNFSHLCEIKKGISNTNTNADTNTNEDSDSFCDEMWLAIQAGNTWTGEFINQRKDGTEYREELNISPVRNEQGEISRFIAISQDITERELTEKTLRRSQRMDALGKLTGGVAHDFNNMLGIVLGYTSLLKDAIKQENISDESQKTLINYADEILRSGNKGAKLTEKLLSFSRHKISSNEITNINDVLYDQQQMLEKTLTARIKLTLELTEDIWPTMISAADFEDAIYNMSINAMHAIDNNGRLTIRTSNEHIDALTAKALHVPKKFSAGDYVLVSITDTGCGMDATTQERIFEPFYTTKDQFGTGLGLAQVYGFVERSGGVIKVFSKPNHGTQLALYFPKLEMQESSNVESIQHPPTLNYAGTETILLVDDEPALLTLTAKVLSRQGYKTLCAEHANQALEILKNQPIDLLFSDVIMPEMDGFQLAAIVSKEYPDVKIQLASGFTDNRQKNALDDKLNKNILHKPYASDTLLKHIRLILDDSPTPAEENINTDASLTDNDKSNIENNNQDSSQSNIQDNAQNNTQNKVQNTKVKPMTNSDNANGQLNGHTILIMDDDEDILELFKLNIERLGCTVLQAVNADAAIDAYKQSLSNNKPIDAVIVDLSIPGSIGGKEVAVLIKQLDSSAKVIVSSGNSTSAEMTHFKENGFDAAIEKTFDRDIIKATLEQVIFS